MRAEVTSYTNDATETQL